ncbi:MAG: MFS transporter [Asticcacaulis sp.]
MKLASPAISPTQLKWLVLACLSLFQFLQMAGTFNSLGVVLPSMVSELGWNWGEAGMGFTLLGLSCGLASIAPAVVIRFLGVRLAIVLGSLLLSAGFLCFAMASGVMVYYAGAICLGLGLALTSTITGSYVLNSLFPGQTQPMGIYFSMGGLGSVAGPLMFLGINNITGSWRDYWVFCALATIVIGVLSTIVTMWSRRYFATASQAGLPDPRPGERHWTTKQAMLSVAFFAIVFGYTAFLLSKTTLHGFASKHLVDMGFSQDLTGQVASLTAVVGIGGSLIAGALGTKIGGKMLMLIAIAFMTIAAVSLTVMSGYPMLAVYIIGLGVGTGLCYVGSVTILIDFFGHRPYLPLFATTCLFSTFAAIGPLLGGMWRDRSGSFDTVFIACALVGMVAFVWLLLTRRPVAPVVEETEDNISGVIELAE